MFVKIYTVKPSYDRLFLETIWRKIPNTQYTRTLVDGQMKTQDFVLANGAFEKIKSRFRFSILEVDYKGYPSCRVWILFPGLRPNLQTTLRFNKNQWVGNLRTNILRNKIRFMPGCQNIWHSYIYLILIYYECREILFIKILLKAYQ